MTALACVCAKCGESFQPTNNAKWNEEQAVKELEQKFPGTRLEECVVLCDDCYKIVMRQ